MLMIRLNKRSNLKKKCKCSENVWKTWRLFISWIRRNWNSITPYWRQERLLMRIPSVFWKRGRINADNSIEILELNSISNSKGMLRRTSTIPKNIRRLPNISYCFKRSLKDLRRVIRVDSTKSGQWTRMKLWLSVRRLRIVIELFMSNN